MVTQADSQAKGSNSQVGDEVFDSQFHEIGIPAVYAATHCTRPQVQQKASTSEQQRAQMFYYED